MEENKSFLTYIAEAVERYRADRRRNPPQEVASRPSRLGRFLRWMVPNGGTLLLILVLILTQRVWARSLIATVNAPGPSATTVNYQGRLADPAGNPLDGNYSMVFSLWDAVSGGTMIWGPETHDAVPVSNGLFSVGLGSRTGGGIPTTVWNGDRYLEITVGGETLSPRELLRSVPIAGMALTVPDGAIRSRHLAPSWYEAYNPSTISTTSTSPVPTGVSISFSCDSDCTALVLHRGLVGHSAQNGRVNVTVLADGSSVLHELAVVNIGQVPPINNSLEGVEGFAFANLSAGSHTIEVQFYCDMGTPGTCYYYGDPVPDQYWEQLNVLVFAQP